MIGNSAMSWDQVLNAVSKGEPCIVKDFKGEVTAYMIRQLLFHATDSEHERPVLREADFTDIRFGPDVIFSGAEFIGDALFIRASFQDQTYFGRRLLTSDPQDLESLEFQDGVIFHDGAFFHKATFSGRVNFTRVEFNGATHFDGAKFQDTAFFSEAVFKQYISFISSTFDEQASFDKTHFRENADFPMVTFGSAYFNNAIINGDAVFNSSNFHKHVSFDDLMVTGIADFAGTTFQSGLHSFRIRASQLKLTSAHLHEGGTLHIHNAVLKLDWSVFGAPTIIKGFQIASGHDPLDEQESWLPILKSMSGVDLSNIVLGDIDLSECIFSGTHNLDKLRLEGRTKFLEPPKGIYLGLSCPIFWRWSRRLVLEEERLWRAATRKWRGWVGSRKLIGTDANAGAERIAKLYRSLRKGREDVKNEPGAADFYYGEMEMRRHGSQRLPEKFVLSLYWGVSGYSLRPARTLLALVFLTSLTAGLIDLYGLKQAISYWDAWQISLASTINLTIVANEQFTTIGNWLRILLRIVGPVLYGLTLLAIRGHVKR